MTTGPGPALPPHLVLWAGNDVVLRRHREEDLPGVVAQCVDPASVEFTTVPSPYGPEQEADFLTACRRDWQAGTVAAFAVVVPPDRGRQEMICIV